MWRRHLGRRRETSFPLPKAEGRTRPLNASDSLGDAQPQASLGPSSLRKAGKGQRLREHLYLAVTRDRHSQASAIKQALHQRGRAS
jgi:hypothetical protein